VYSGLLYSTAAYRHKLFFLWFDKTFHKFLRLALSLFSKKHTHLNRFFNKRYIIFI